MEAAAQYVLSQRGYVYSQRETPTVQLGEVPEIAPIQPREDFCDSLRLNLLVPTIDVSHSFGGVSTAVRVFEQLGNIVQSTSDVRLRIITDTPTSDESIVDLSKWSMRDTADADPRHQIIDNAPTRTIPFSRHDVFVATYWTTAFRARGLRAWQERSFGRPAAPLVYIVQDFEPAFYPWSSRYAYAEETYAHGADTIAIFNSLLLRKYFEELRYSFLATYHFEPRLDSVLKRLLRPDTTKSRRILVYGRPSSARNCFEVICAGLKKWAQTSRDARKWAIVSAGEKHANVPLGNGLEIQSVGKLSLPDYARMLNECAVGISLMLSPHPSYPPLEMAHSGILTITNSYRNKDLSSWHENIYSIARVMPEEVAEGVQRCTMLFEENNAAGWKGASKVPFYLRDDETEECLYDVARAIRALD